MAKIGILGSGTVGQTLAKGLKQLKNEVMIGTNHPEKLEQLKKDNIAVSNFSDAAKFGDILILAVKGLGAIDTLKPIPAEYINGKTIIDTTNPIAEDKPPVNGVLHFYTDPGHSLMESLQEEFPSAHFVKAFNSIGSLLMVNPSFESTPTMFICGDDDNAKKQTAEIVTALGFEPEDMGKKEAARAIEPLCILWCIPGFASNSWNTHAFKLLKRKRDS